MIVIHIADVMIAATLDMEKIKPAMVAIATAMATETQMSSIIVR